MTMQLCTLAEVRAMLEFKPANTGDDGLIESVIIPAVTDMIQNQCQFTFGTLMGTLKADACPPYLYGDTLFFRDNVLTGIDNFTSDTGTLTPGMYDLLPLNSASKTRARLRPGNSWMVGTPQRAFTITGTLGYGTLPSDVNFAATKLAAWMYQTRDSSGDIQVVGDVTHIPAEAPPLVLRIIGKYEHSQGFA